MTIKEAYADVLKRVKYKKVSDKLENGMIVETYSKFDKKDNTKYDVKVMFTVHETYIFAYKDSTGGCCNYTSVMDFIRHMLSVHEGLQGDLPSTYSVITSGEHATNFSSRLDTKHNQG